MMQILKLNLYHISFSLGIYICAIGLHYSGRLKLFLNCFFVI